MDNIPHIPVMLEEVIGCLNPKDGEVYVDATFGAGGYTKGILSIAKCNVYAIDRDPNVKQYVDIINKEYPGMVRFLPGRFSQMVSLLNHAGVNQVNGVVLDIGVSSMQLDQGNRGFSFMREGPLDMRMECEGPDAADFINTAREQEIADVIYKYGGERKSRQIAKAILQEREKAPISTTTKLAEIVRKIVRSGKEKIDPSTRTFQALRIFINNELNELSEALLAAENILAPGGRLVVVCFHSLEDSIVKEFFNRKSGKHTGVSRHAILVSEDRKKSIFNILTKRVIVPSEDEVIKNPRARSAKLRAAVRV